MNRRRFLIGTALPVGLILSGCSTGSGGSAGPSGPAQSSSTVKTQTDKSTSESGTPGSAAPSATDQPSASAACIDSTVARMTPAQRAGQLIMVGMTQDGTATVRSSLQKYHVGAAYYAGGWKGSKAVASASADLQRTAARNAMPGLLIGADQEGGQVQQLRGDGFPSLVSALEQAKMTPAVRTAYAAAFARQLRGAGVNLDLAPVADTVPTSIGVRNSPVGKFGRQYGSDPKKVAAAVSDVLRGFKSADLAATLKHFPGIGRIPENTDYSSTGITDPTMTATDPYLAPFTTGIKQGAPVVMMSSARYPKLDAAQNATFSPAIITGLLRGKLGFDGVVITDDLHTPALAATPVADRAVRFLQAGGDVLLTAAPDLVPGLTSGLTAKMASDTAFPNMVAKSVRRVIALKASLGLIRCS